MKVIRRESSFRGTERPVVTLGNFDGIHLGHQKILGSVVRRARALGAPALVYTFDPHPLKVVSPSSCPPLILSMEDKKALMEEAGVDYLVLARFTEDLAATAPGDFARRVIGGLLRAREVIVGENFSFGKGRSGTVARLGELGRDLGFTVKAVPPCMRGGKVVSSSRIRALITGGEVKKAASLLGRPFSVRGRVVRGEAIGRELGFPTANIEPTGELIPASGVYAAIAVLGNMRQRGVVNIGTRPTFKGRQRTIEVHILDFSGDIYGREVTLMFMKRLREERTFPGRHALVRQMERDLALAKRILTGEDIP